MESDEADDDTHLSMATSRSPAHRRLSLVSRGAITAPPPPLLKPTNHSVSFHSPALASSGYGSGAASSPRMQDYLSPGSPRLPKLSPGRKSLPGSPLNSNGFNTKKTIALDAFKPTKKPHSKESKGGGVMTDAQKRFLKKLKDTKYTIQDIVNEFTKDEIVRMMEEFESYHNPDGKISISDRISSGQRIDRIVGMICDLFMEIDSDEDDKVEWNDFINYMVDLGMQHRGFMEDDMVRKGWDRMKQSDENHHFVNIEKIYYFPHLPIVFAVEKSTNLRFFHPHSLHLQHTMKVKDSSSFIACEHIPDFNMMAASLSNNIIGFWDLAGMVQKRRIKTMSAQASLHWNSKASLLFSGSTTGTVYGWDINSLADKFLLPGHEDSVTDMTYDHDLDTLMTCSLDSTVRVWDISSQTCRSVLHGHHKGICSISFAKPYTLIMSAGFDKDVFVWNPFIKKHVTKLKGHQSSLVATRYIPDSHMLFTADREGFIKLWDIRTFTCMQTMNTTSMKELTSFAVISPTQFISSTYSKINLYEYKEHNEATFEEGHPMTCLLYNSSASTFVSASGVDLKIWDGSTGILCKTHHEMTPSEITAMCFDYREKRIFVGDNAGYIKSYGYQNGNLIRQFVPHPDEITFLAYSNKVKALASISSGRAPVINIHIDTDDTRNPIVKSMTGQGGIITCAALLNEFGILATGSTDRSIYLWDIHKYGCEGIVHMEGEVTALAFLGSAPVIVACDSLGNIRFFTTHPMSNKNNCIKHIVNSPNTPFSILKMTFYPSQYKLFTVDERNHLRVWYLSFLDSCQDLISDSEQNEFTVDKEEDFSNSRKWQDYFSRSNSAKLNEPPSLLHQWTVSDDLITCMIVVEDPFAVVFTLFDGKARLFAEDGAELGVFPPSSESDLSGWAFNVKSENQSISRPRTKKLANIVLREMSSSPGYIAKQQESLQPATSRRQSHFPVKIITPSTITPKPPDDRRGRRHSRASAFMPSVDQSPRISFSTSPYSDHSPDHDSDHEATFPFRPSEAHGHH